MKIEFEPNQLIDNRYKIIKKLDEGGMGAVWKATDSRTNDSAVVLKFPLKYRDPEILERFAREAGTMRELAGDCANILDIQDIGSVSVSDIDSVPYYVMRFQTGGDLRSWTVPKNDDGNPIFNRDTLSWVTGVATALDFLHHQDDAVFHRDVKPENILFDASGTPKLSDFGIVKNIKKATTNITQTGAAMGTVAYMPPEIWRGGKFSPASDQFSFAATVYEMISGKRPYDGETPFAMLEALHKGHEKLDETIGLSATASRALDKALSHEPVDRFESCGVFAKTFLQRLSREEERQKKPSEMATGLHAGVSVEEAGGSAIVGGNPIAVTPPVVDGPSSTGKLSPKPPTKPPQKPEPISAGESSKVAPLAVVGVLTLVGLIGAGLYFSGALISRNTSPSVHDVALNSEGSKQKESEGSRMAGSDSSYLSTDSDEESLSYEEYLKAGTSLVRRHATLGYDVAQDVLGDYLSSGEQGLDQDEIEAERWYRKAAEQGNMHAQYSLSKLYRPRYGDHVEVEEDRAEAFLWMRRSAERGNAEAYSNLASDYRYGNGVEVDGGEAVSWYKKAAEKDNSGDAQFQLGEIFEEGIVVRQDIPQSRRWFRRAEDLGLKYPNPAKRLEFGVGQKAPDLTGKDGDGVHFKLSDYRGKVVWLTFWTKL